MNTKFIEKPQINNIVLACCTYKRPRMLSLALESIKELNFPQNTEIQVLIIDNDVCNDLQDFLTKTRTYLPFSVHYVQEAKRGLAAVRNRLLSEAVRLGASHIAMFDDDEILDKNWLIEHINLYNTDEKAFISSGPTYTKFLQKSPAYIRKNNIFKTSTTKKTGTAKESCASGNVFFPVDIMTRSGILFDEKYNFMGGEDGDFFERASKSGYTIVWNADAINYEMVDESRANLKWILERCYFNGYKSSYLNSEKYAKKSKKQAYLYKLYLVLFLNSLILIPSIIFGLTLFFNVLGMGTKTYGKIDGLLKGERPDYYTESTGQ